LEIRKEVTGLLKSTEKQKGNRGKQKTVCSSNPGSPQEKGSCNHSHKASEEALATDWQF
jgi:hypothetical protein